MIIKRKVTQCLLLASFAAITLGISNTANASAFQLFEGNAVNMGDFGAGGAAIAQDASTAIYNPAGLIRIPNQQLVLSGDVVTSDIRFNGTNIWSSNNNPLAPPPFVFAQSGTAQGGTTNLIPAVHYAAPMSDCFVLGFSVDAPFGLQTSYGDSSILRYSATETSIQVIDLSPSAGLKFNDHFSIGAGFDAEKLSATFDSIAGLHSPFIPNNVTTFDSQSKNDASGWGYGWHAGVLYQFNCATRVGATYHSKVNFNDLSGRSKLQGPLVNLANFVTTGGIISGELSTNALRADATLPASTTVSFYHDINPCWAVDGSVIYTQWNQFNDILTLRNVQAVGLNPATGLPAPVLIDVNVPENFHNTWRFALGGVYRPLPCVALRAGIGYDQTPVNSHDLNSRLPDGNRYALAIGAHYQVIKAAGIDVGWTHLFIQKTNSSIPNVTGSQVSTAIGSYTAHADLIGAQLTWDFI